MARLFIAVWPPAPLVEQLQRLERPERKGLRWTTQDQWHVTLRFLGRVDDDAGGPLRDALDATAASVRQAPEAVAGPRPGALGPAVWVLPVEGLAEVAGAVGAATASFGEPPPDGPFHGHLTLARARQPAARRGLPAPELTASWAVTELTLVQSTLDPDGARYDVVGRWALGAG